MVIFEVGTSWGVVGRCDAKCYDAEGPDCHCICGGANHGVGSKIALEDRRFIPDEELLQACEELWPGDKAEVYRPRAKLILPDKQPGLWE